MLFRSWVLPSAVGLGILAEPLCRLFFERGAFSPSDTAGTAAMLRMYAVAVFGICFHRVAVPVYKGRSQVGRATSTTWSTTLKKLIALATVDAPHYEIGTRLEMEVTVEGVRHRAGATVVPIPFFNPSRKQSISDF